MKKFLEKFWIIVKVHLVRALTYRFTVLAYRIGEMGEILILIVMWSAIYGNQQSIKGFTLQEMITYLLVGNLFQVMVRNFLVDAISQDIKEGRLSLALIRPMSYFQFILTREVGRISVSTFMSVGTQAIVLLFFSNKVVLNTDLGYLMVILMMLVLAFITELLISYLIGLIAFWSDEVEGVSYTIDRLRRFFSGGYFPLSLLPPVIVSVSFALPFAYSFFMPAQLYLKKVDILTGISGLGVQVVWIVVLYLIINFVWNKGLKRYEGVGI